MLAHAIHLLLIPAILGCPLLCTGGAGGVFAACCEANEAPLQKTDRPRLVQCCTAHAECSEQAADDEPARPGDGRPAEHSCQCFCGGAILVDALQIEQRMDVSLTPSGAVIGPPLMSLSGLNASSPTQLLLRPSGRTAVSGSQLRCLYQSFLI